jgi:hypothetical protein
VNTRVGGTASHTLHATTTYHPPATAKPTDARYVMISRLRLVCSAVRLKWALEMDWR